MTVTGLLLRSEGRRAFESGRARRLRCEARISQREFADAIGVSAAAVCRWEMGNRLPRGEVAERVGELLRELEEELASPQMREAGFPASEPRADENVNGNGTTPA